MRRPKQPESESPLLTPKPVAAEKTPGTQRRYGARQECQGSEEMSASIATAALRRKAPYRDLFQPPP